MISKLIVFDRGECTLEPFGKVYLINLKAISCPFTVSLLKLRKCFNMLLVIVFKLEWVAVQTVANKMQPKMF